MRVQRRPRLFDRCSRTLIASLETRICRRSIDKRGHVRVCARETSERIEFRKCISLSLSLSLSQSQPLHTRGNRKFLDSIGSRSDQFSIDSTGGPVVMRAIVWSRKGTKGVILLFGGRRVILPVHNDRFARRGKGREG